MSAMHHRRAGYPFGSLVDFAVDSTGCPLFSLSPLAIHTRNLIEDPRSTLVVQMPGWTGLSNARVTLFGDVHPLPQESQRAAREIFGAKHSKRSLSQQWGNLSFFRMSRISDIYFVGGFGTVQWVDVAEYSTTAPDAITSHAQRCLDVLNASFGRALGGVISRDLASANAGTGATTAGGGAALAPSAPLNDASLISIDRRGADVRVRQGALVTVRRLRFSAPVDTVDQAVAEMHRVCAPHIVPPPEIA